MKVIAQLLSRAHPLKLGFHLEIENPPFQNLIIEDTRQRGPRGLAVISVAHYSEQNGDQMCDPEMLFEAEWFGTQLTLKPYYFRNDFAGVEQYSAVNEGGQLRIDTRLQREHEDFAKLWNTNLEQQGFLEASLRSGPSDQAPATPVPPIQATNHGDGTMSIVVTHQGQIEWLRSMGVSEQFLTHGEHRLSSEDRRRVYPSLSEAIESTLTRVLNTGRRLPD